MPFLAKVEQAAAQARYLQVMEMVQEITAALVSQFQFLVHQ
jgi:hypothetical protein